MAQQSAVAAALKSGSNAAKTDAPKGAPSSDPKPKASDTSEANAEQDKGAGPTAEPAPAEPKQPITPLLASQWKARESGVFFNTHEVVPNAGTPFEHLLRPEFWSNVSQKFKPGDTILAFPRDGVWYAQLLVWDAGMNWANVTGGHMEKPRFAQQAGLAEDFEIGRDPIDGWVIRRKSTGAKVKGNFPNAQDAQSWIRDHQRALRA